MKTIPEKTVKINSEANPCEKFMERFRIKALLRGCGLVKKCGIEAYMVFLFLMNLIFTRKNLYRYLESENASFSKDTVYRLLNNPSVNWENLLSKTANCVIPEVRKLTGDERRCALIVDDTPLYRNRSKKVELLSRCYDHSENRYFNGFSVLTLGWSDGVTFMPVDYRVIASTGDGVICESTVTEDKRTNATKRRMDAQTPKPELLLNMLKNVKGTPAECQYVLMDSWFTNPQSLSDIKGLGFDVVGRLKKDKTHFLYNGEKKNVKQIFSANRKRPGKSKYLLSVEVTVARNAEQTPLRLVFVRNKNRRKDWIVFVSTDMTLTEDEIITLYGKRWDIEPFFKVCKQNLKMESEFQSRSFDAISAHVAVVFIRYVMLSIASRENIDDKSVCAIYFAICDELPDITLSSALNLIAQILTECINDYQKINKVSLEALYVNFLAAMPVSIRDMLVA